MEESNSILTTAILRVLRPLVRVLLRHEVAHAEFCELAKHAYVESAKKYFALPGRKLTHSRLAVLTGLSRKEILRISETSPSENGAASVSQNRARRVIRGWLDDPAFHDEQGEPKVLPLRGDISFETLAMRYSGDITGRAVLDELIRVGAVEKTGEGHARLRQKGYLPVESDTERLKILAKHTADLLETGAHNLQADAQHLRFQRQLTYHDINEDIAREFQEFSRARAMDLLVELDRWLAEKKKSQIQNDEIKQVRVGMGIYYFENEGTED